MPQEINVTLDPATRAALIAEGYALYALSAFETTSTQGQALVWLETAVSDHVTITFMPVYQAYIGMAVAKVDLGDIVALDEDDNLTCSKGGHARGVTFRNDTKVRQTAGLALGNDSAPIPISAVPLDGLGEDIIVPLDTVLLTFSTAGLAQGAPLRHSMSQSLLYRVSTLSVEVGFHIDAGWSFGAAPWFHAIAAGEDLFAVLAKPTSLGEA